MKRKLREEEFQEFVVEQFGKLTAELVDSRLEMQTGFRELRAEATEIKEILEPLVKAFDNDAEKIIEHDRRIGRLEDHVAIPKHA